MRRFATPEVAHDLQQSGFALGGKRVQGTVMFSDIRDFTPLVEAQSPEDSIELLNTYYTLMFNAISGHGGIASQIGLAGHPIPIDAATRSPVAGTCIARSARTGHLPRQSAAGGDVRGEAGDESGDLRPSPLRPVH